MIISVRCDELITLYESHAQCHNYTQAYMWPTVSIFHAATHVDAHACTVTDYSNIIS